MKGTILILAGLLAVLAGGAVQAQAVRPGEGVFRYVSVNEEGRWAGQPALKIKVTPALGGPVIELVVPTELYSPNVSTKLYSPKPLPEFFQTLQPGEFLVLWITVPTPANATHLVLINPPSWDEIENGIRDEPNQFARVFNSGFNPSNYNDQGVIAIGGISRYQYTPGEIEPGVYVFRRATATEVVLSKFLASQTVPLMTRKDDKDNVFPDPELKKSVEGLAPDRCVKPEFELVNSKPILKAISPYIPPPPAQSVKRPAAPEDEKPSASPVALQHGTFAGLTEVKVGEVKLPAVEIVTGAGTVKLVVQSLTPLGGKLTPLPELLKQVQNLKAGQAVLYKTRKDELATWLTNILPAPEPETAVAPAPAK